MRYTSFLTLWICLSVLLLTVQSQQPPNNQQPQQNENQPQDIQQEQRGRRERDPCDPDDCRKCNQQVNVCMECKKGLFLDRKKGGICVDRDEHEDRGDGISMAIGIINIIFIIVFTLGWMYLSRNNQSSYVSLDQNDQTAQLNQHNLQQLQQQQNPMSQPQMVNIGAPSEKTSVFELRSKKGSQVTPVDEEQNFYDEKKRNQQQNNEGSPVGFESLKMQQIPNNSPNNQPTNYPTSHQQTVTSDLNGYWMTQAGKFSFKNFSNLHRIKHVMINLFILQRLFSTLLTMSGRRGDDYDEDERKNLLFVGFAIVILLQWLFTFIPSIILKIFSCCFCLKNDPNGRCSSYFINIIFYVASIVLTLLTTNAIFRMDGFEAQVWILLVLSGFLLCIFFDKKSVEFAKRNRNGKMESLVRFRKIDFNSQIAQS